MRCSPRGSANAMSPRTGVKLAPPGSRPPGNTCRCDRTRGSQTIGVGLVDLHRVPAQCCSYWSCAGREVGRRGPLHGEAHQQSRVAEAGVDQRALALERDRRRVVAGRARALGEPEAPGQAAQRRERDGLVDHHRTAGIAVALGERHTDRVPRGPVGAAFRTAPVLESHTHARSASMLQVAASLAVQHWLGWRSSSSERLLPSECAT